MNQIKERSSQTVMVKFFDSEAAAVVPATARYRIDCETTGKELLGWTELTPATEIEIFVPASMSAIQARANAFEIKTLTAQINHDSELCKTETISWRVQNVLGVE